MYGLSFGRSSGVYGLYPNLLYPFISFLPFLYIVNHFHDLFFKIISLSYNQLFIFRAFTLVFPATVQFHRNTLKVHMIFCGYRIMHTLRKSIHTQKRLSNLYLFRFIFKMFAKPYINLRVEICHYSRITRSTCLK